MSAPRLPVLALLALLLALPARGLGAAWLATSGLASGASVQGTPAVAVDGAGVQHVAWGEQAGAAITIRHAERAPGGSWRTEMVTTWSDSTLGGRNVVMAANARGDVLLAWDR
ncbi:MAG: hypothetical protein MUE51_14440, partial [Thermoleophilia bacterium]|nr:hypothetical protein [Thermoleophilia bacterium]